ncbi:hypothetical protein F2Q68_00025782 [Brassica cretica]|uniref:Uncharacterized protein n=1 Tax=Brassica cretica TaxID=69181 RepID=A0A8S9IFK0_BRACR|nr:hypothetical protein F2Q68_00025782 [Brassica cretica]
MLYVPYGLEYLALAGGPSELTHQPQQDVPGSAEIPHPRAMTRPARTLTSPSISISFPYELVFLFFELIPDMMQNFLFFAIDRHGVDGIDRCSGQIAIHTSLACLKEPKLTSTTNLTLLLVLGLGIRGIGFFKQVWKVESEQDLVATTIKVCSIRIPTKKNRTGLGGGNLQGSLHKEFLDIGQKEVNRTWWQPPLSLDSWKPA